jgi:4'-phosphopantetheinyl transferase EntD
LPFPEEDVLERRFSTVCGAPITVAVVSSALDVEELTVGEMEALSLLGHARRRRSWLTGRAALKRLLAKLERDQDTAKLSFPHRELSLSHSGETAVAVAVGSNAGGVGVDIELSRPVRPAMARFFLREGEQDYVNELTGSEKERELLRLWTVKEALFKSDLNNASRGVMNYRVVDPAARQGFAHVEGEGDSLFSYGSFESESCVVSCAVKVEKVG